MIESDTVPATPAKDPSRVKPGAKRVLMVSSDGLRPDAIPIADTPIIQSLIAAGAYQATALAEVPSSTLPNHTSMVTGLTIGNHGVWFNSKVPGRVSSKTVFDIARAAGLQVGFFANKGKLSYLCEEGTVEAWQIMSGVDPIADAAIAAIAEHDLSLIFLHFGEPDGVGHREGWMTEPYFEQVGAVDRALGRVLDALEEKGVLDETLIIVTSDHGGLDKQHGLDIPEHRLVPFILKGPGVAAGRKVCAQQLRPMDMAATALHFLGLPTKTAADGANVAEAFAAEEENCEPEAPLFALPCAPIPIMMAAPTLFGLVAMRRRAQRRR